MNFNKISACALALGLSGSAFARVGGVVEGFGNLKRDDVLDGALVIPSLRPGALLAFQFQNLLGPSEEMSAGPLKVSVPGNFYFPRQSESYGIFPITITKENFGLYVDSNQNEELQAIAFQAPFSKLVDMAQNKKPFTQMLPFLKLKKSTLTADQKWSEQNAVKLTLDKSLLSEVPYSWNKRSGGAEAADSIMLFQSTPANRWAVADINGQPATQGNLNKIETLGNAFKAFFIRALTRSGEQAPYAIVGQIRTSEHGERLEAGELPEQLGNVQIQGDDQVSWQAFNRDGWLAVARGGDKKSGPSQFIDMSFGLGQLPGIQAISDWVRPDAGVIKLKNPVASGESLLVVFIGSSRPVGAPAQGDENPDLFTYAEEIRMATMKK